MKRVGTHFWAGGTTPRLPPMWGGGDETQEAPTHQPTNPPTNNSIVMVRNDHTINGLSSLVPGGRLLGSGTPTTPPTDCWPQAPGGGGGGAGRGNGGGGSRRSFCPRGVGDLRTVGYAAQVLSDNSHHPLPQ